MKKVLSASFATLMLTTGMAAPAFASQTPVETKVVPNQKTNLETSRTAQVSFSKEVLASQGYNTSQIGTNEGKIGLTVKGAIKVLNANKERVNAAIKAGVNKLPGLTKAQKAKWISYLSVNQLTEYLAAYTSWGDNIEGAIYQSYIDIGAPVWIAKPIAVTVTYLIPFL
ncbi:hypothetical protein [Macrococcoides caseolyticum]|uniref:hypothetical protein n=1 Tax=Macrococcoides caseolyticum TaxID=69966 RepID=UPI000C32AA24|nr:hypothetical protein [Macrococcus caseolyticus]PKE16179.1 hypothetical protein CW718_11015 [Macrococcus caseolyticus]PKE52080.1 hypothetical protein CW676_11295 [Macrococcus caseolyticus]PKE73544.1 hypothetical protein CW670_11490 [Macrococcus caseolyticus]PKF05305.1 hypothetical protein CW698_10630 [Macrococcus caseolyticus]PKF20392.1 hypothetical protein CW684_11010 [Macrococcus caseolyticus]